LAALNALGACRYDEASLRKQIVNNCLDYLPKEDKMLRNQDLLIGLKGLALSPDYNDDKSKELARKLAE